MVLMLDEPFETKLKKLITSEIDMLLQNQELPLFIVNEIAHNPEKLQEKIKHLPVREFRNEFSKQVRHEIRKGTIRNIDPRQLIMNLIALSVWPFVAKPMLMTVMELDQKEFEKMMQQRKIIIADTMIRSIQK